MTKFNKVIVCLTIGLTTLHGCSSFNHSKNKNIPSINKYLISEYDVPEDYFINNYRNNKLKNYDKQKTDQLYNNLKKQSTNYSSLNKNDIFNLMGIPSLVKSANKQEIWQYRSKNCILNITWNQTNNTISNFISYDGNLENINPKTCLLSVISSVLSRK